MVNAGGPHCIGIFKIGLCLALCEAGATHATSVLPAGRVGSSIRWCALAAPPKHRGNALLTNWLRGGCRARVGTERKSTSEVSGNADHEVLPDKAGRDEVDVVGILKYERLEKLHAT